MAVSFTYHGERTEEGSGAPIDYVGAQRGAASTLADGAVPLIAAPGLHRFATTAAATIRFGSDLEDATGGETWPANHVELRYLADGDSIAVGLLGDELVDNGAFADSTGWTLGGDGLGSTISGGKLNGDETDAAWAGITASDTLGAGTYRVKYTIDSISAGTVQIKIGTTDETGTDGTAGTSHNAAGTYSENIVVAAVDGQVISLLMGTTDAVIDNLSVKPVL